MWQPEATVEHPHLGKAPTPDEPTGTCVVTVDTGSSVEITYEPLTERVKLKANVQFG